MRPWVTLGKAPLPGGGEITLVRRSGEFVLRADGFELMSSRLHASEESLAEVALEPGSSQRVLIGGLGMGFTLRAALDVLGPEAEVVVAELVPEVVAWNRGPLVKLAHHPLQDPRARVHIGDVAELIKQRSQWDAILLDVDNGAEAFTIAENYKLYQPEGLMTLRDSLAPGGVLAIWSSGPNRSFERRLRRNGFRNETVRVRDHDGQKRQYHYIFVARPTEY